MAIRGAAGLVSLANAPFPQRAEVGFWLDQELLIAPASIETRAATETATRR